jgi:DNA-binding transcriptional LysR family regulator
MSATAVEPLVELATQGMGIACLPPFAIRGEIADGRLWPASRQITPKLRAFVDFMAEHLQPQ